MLIRLAGRSAGWPIAVFVRSRGLLRAVVVLLTLTVCAALVPSGPVAVRFRLAAVGLAPIVAALPGIVLPTLLDHPEPRLEPTRALRVRAVRAAWLALLLATYALVGSIAFGGGPGALAVSARSLAFAAGLGLLTAQLVPSTGSWLPAAGLVALTFLYGTASVTGRPYAWALLLRPERSPLAGLTATALLAAGAGFYVARDSRS